MCYVHVAALVAEYLRRKGALTIYFMNCIHKISFYSLKYLKE